MLIPLNTKENRQDSCSPGDYLPGAGNETNKFVQINIKTNMMVSDNGTRKNQSIIKNPTYENIMDQHS